MTTPNDVLISGYRHLIVLGQFGNLQAKINQLEHMINVYPAPELNMYLSEIETELDYLKKVYPQLDGGLSSEVLPDAPPVDTQVPGPINGVRQKHKLMNALKDMRVLMDAAKMGYVTEGVISCHLKVMLDEAWLKAAEVAGLDNLDDIPF